MTIEQDQGQTGFTLTAAQEYAEKGDIEGWVHLFLNGEGNNAALSEGLKRRPRHWIGPIEVDLACLERVVGPEPHFEYVENEDWWNLKITQISERIRSGWDTPPLIAQHINGTFSVRDGNHRLGAMEKLGRKSCHVVIWDDENSENIWQSLGKWSI